ncbi:MAG: PIN domain-containing protein [Fimbriimonadales bacterium]|nr:PIN domain-containing protein [Fimbriimonadales bacterium]
MRKVYLDSAPVIYFVEQTPNFYARVRARLQPDDWLIICDLTRLECRILPLRQRNVGLLADFDLFFTSYVNQIIPLSSDVIDKATEIRAYHRYNLADSIHLAAAVLAECDLFLTNDMRLASFGEIPIVTL